MTKKDFFRLIIKLFGLYSLITVVFSDLPKDLMMIYSQAQIAEYSDNFSTTWLVLAAVAVVVFTSAILVALIFKPDCIIRMLKLEKGFDDDQTELGSLNNENIIKLGLIVIGGALIINNVPLFFAQSLTAFKSAVGGGTENYIIKFTKASEYIAWGSSFFKALLGYLMVTKYNSISKMFSGKGKNSE